MLYGFAIKKQNTKSSPAVCRIDGGRYDGQYICLIKKGGAPYVYVEDGILQQIPFKMYERDALYIVGASGSGKSYYAGKYAEEYHKANPNNQIAIISPKKEDPALDKIPNSIRIKLSEENFIGADPEEVEAKGGSLSSGSDDEEYISMWNNGGKQSDDEENDVTPISLDELRNTLTIYDDVEALTNNKTLRQGVNALRDKILTLGRSKKISTITISHQVTDNLQTRIPIIESQFITFFPSQPNYQLTRYFKVYLGLEEKVLKHLTRHTGGSRFVTVHKNIPMFYFCERLVGMITPEWIDSLAK